MQILQVSIKILVIGGMVPVQLGVVEERLDAFGVAAVHKFPDQIPLCGGMGGIKRVQPLGVVQRKTVMVPGGDGNILSAGSFRDAGQLPAVELGDSEVIGQLAVFFLGNLLCPADPFALAQQCVQTPVDKHTEAHFLKIFDAFFRYGNCHMISSL
jgi:hypothetical protein